MTSLLDNANYIREHLILYSWSFSLSGELAAKREKNCGQIIDYLLFMCIAPVNSMLDWSAFVIIFNRPVMLQWHQTSGVEIVVVGFYK